MMRASFASIVLALGVTGLAVGCSDGFGDLRNSSTLQVTVQSGELGAKDKRIPITFTDPKFVVLHIEAHRPDGSIDNTFNGAVRISTKPGTVKTVTGPNTSGRNVFLKDGVASDVSVGLVGAYGNTRVLVDDVGYTPVDPTRLPDAPACADGKDNDGDHLTDFPTDTGCAFANDDNEEAGSFVGGASPTIFFVLPRIADVRGVSQGGASTAFPHEQIALDTGYDPDKNRFEHSVVVTRIASDGFYMTDIDDPRGYSSVFAFNFNTPPRLRVCDRLTTMTGTAADFFGFTELGFPTWATEEYDPKQRGCLVPEPFVLTPAGLADVATKLKNQSALVRVITKENLSVHVGSHFGPGFPGPDLKMTDDATNCDFNQDGKLDFTNDPEKTCAANCTADLECTEYSNFASRSGFRLVVTDSVANSSGTIQVDASTTARVDPIKLRGQTIKSFTGTLRYFSGGSQFTIEARCEDDIVVDTKAEPLAADKACVFPRTLADTNAGSN
ncbi:MAG: hypothetical protein JWM74_3964 [Myxococcaceae bacterium]|jgi:hypothetical protein|nr:hypothetical protein [Myxococcaceae bacterium]